jgi:gas vesicle protein
MNADTPEHQDHRFVMGLMAGTFVGAGLVAWLAPRATSELRQRIVESAKSCGQQASEHYRQASTRVGATVDELARKGRDVRNDVADAVAQGAHEMERYATAAKSAPVTEARKR